MKYNDYAILGIPVQNLALRPTSEKILSLIYNHKEGEPPHYISTINADYIANVHSWGPIEPKYPELLKVVRESNFTTPDGMPLILLSELLGRPLIGRVTGSDLVPDLLELLTSRGRSVYLLGGDEEATHLAADILKNKYEGLKIAGIDCPKIYVTGPHLLESPQRDALIVEKINEANPDVLLISLGSPKQEIWFNRVRNQLHVSVAIGIGGSLNFIAGKVKRAPMEFQKSGFEWLWRLSQEPRRLLPRYLYDFTKLVWLGVPLIIYHRLNAFLTRLLPLKDTKKNKNLLFNSIHNSVCVVKSPQRLNSISLTKFDTDMKNAFELDVMILDFRETMHMDIQGISYLIQTWIRAKNENKKIYALGIRLNVKILLILNKVWDLVRMDSFKFPEDIVNQCDPTHIYEAINQEDNLIQISLFGSLDKNQNFEDFFYRLSPMLRQKNCLLDFSFCTFADNTAMEFLLKLRQMVLAENKHIQITGLNKTVKNQLKAAKLLKLFQPQRTKRLMRSLRVKN